MHGNLPRILETFPLFNIQPITENDFWRACKRKKVVVLQFPLMVNGYYERRGGRDFILLNQSLRGVAWLHTALHEFCHVLCDEPLYADQYTLYKRLGIPSADPREKFADAFALIGLIPIHDLIKLLEEDLADELHSMCQARIEVFQIYGL